MVINTTAVEICVHVTIDTNLSHACINILSHVTGIQLFLKHAT
jgi:hypothetical protein